MNVQQSVAYDTQSILPVRGNDATEILINDHVVIKSLLDELTTAQAVPARKRVLDSLIGVLTIHNATEENLVYPALAEIAGKKTLSQHLYHETAAADILVFELDTMLKTGSDENFGKTAEALKAAILEHIDDEENKAFDRIRKHAEPQEAEMLTASVREFRSNLTYKTAR